MSGIPMIHRDGTKILHPTLWVDPDEVPVLFLAVKDGAVALAHPDYIDETLHSVMQGDLALRDAWDHLLVKTSAMPYPQPCEVMADTLDTVAVWVNGEMVYRASV
jgi:hypothetical protein